MIPRTGLHPILVALCTLLVKEVMRFLRIWTQTLLPPVITMALYFIIFGKYIGSRMPDIDGVTYIQFLVPGLIMMAVITNSYSNTASSFFLTKFNKSIDEMLVSPMPAWVILLGFMFGGMLRGILVGIAVTLMALLFTNLPIYHPFIVMIVVALAAAVFSLGGLINGIFAKRFDDIAFVPTFVLTPLTYLGGVFYSLKQIPEPWHTLSIFNPIFDIIDTFRFGMLGITDVNIYIGFLLICSLFIILFLWTWYLLQKGSGIKV